MDKWKHIKPLQNIPMPGARGRPSQWYEGIHVDYDKYRKEGISHDELLECWCVNKGMFTNWLARDVNLSKVYHAWYEVDITERLTKPEEREAPKEYTKEALRQLASEALQDLIASMRSRPSAYKPQEIITACREALDRTEGKPLQTTQVNQQTTYTIIAAIPAPPNSLGLQAPPLVREAHSIDASIIEDDSIYS